MSETTSTWTKELVQSHAQVAVAIEFYTIPFYLTALTSINKTSEDYTSSTTNQDIYAAIESVVLEEMLHLELAANLCIALDTTPNFTAPQYGVAIPYLKPDDPDTSNYSLIHAELGPFDETRLKTMLDIETPTTLENASGDESTSIDTPTYPYNTIGEMYNALLAGIQSVGASNFNWDTTNQQYHFRPDQASATPQVSQLIGSYEEAQDAVALICAQGEGSNTTPITTGPPYQETDFPIASEYQVQNESGDPSPLNQYSHYGRFIKIQNELQANNWSYPPTYSTSTSPASSDAPAYIQWKQNSRAVMKQAACNSILMVDYANLIDTLNYAWSQPKNTVDFFPTMKLLLQDAVNCWAAGAVPMWTA